MGFKGKDKCGLDSDNLAAVGGILFCLVFVLCLSFADKFSMVGGGNVFPGQSFRFVDSLFLEDCIAEAEILFNTVFV
jgi:hypothetical protein